jgi:hypothetical protein
VLASVEDEQAHVEVIVGQDRADFPGDGIDHRLEIQLAGEGAGNAEKVMQHVFGEGVRSLCHGLQPVFIFGIEHFSNGTLFGTAGSSRVIMAPAWQKERTFQQVACGIPHQVCTIDH